MVESLVTSIKEALEGVIPAELIAFVVSLFPILELRGGMIAARLLSVPFWRAFLLCYLGNMLPMPLILIFIRRFVNWCKTKKVLKWFADWMEKKTAKNKDKVLKYERWGLLLFVAIPLPMTGGWTGSLVAAMLDMPLKKSLPVVALGVLIAGLIMTLLTYGLFAWA